MATVQCGTCRQEKPDSEFYRRRRTNKNGTLYVHTQQPCKVCRLKYMHMQYPPRRPVVPAGYKICPRCRQVLLIENFGKDAGRRDGRQVYCHECWPSYVASYNKRPHAAFMHTERAKKVYLAPAKRRKKLARDLTALAVMFGYLTPPAICEHPGCPATKINPHHTQYEKPLDGLRWLCRAHHLEAHGGRWDGNGEA